LLGHSGMGINTTKTHNAAKLNNAGGAGMGPDIAIPRYSCRS
jgi:hypothetical protein